MRHTQITLPVSSSIPCNVSALTFRSLCSAVGPQMLSSCIGYRLACVSECSEDDCDELNLQSVTVWQSLNTTQQQGLSSKTNCIHGTRLLQVALQLGVLH